MGQKHSCEACEPSSMCELADLFSRYNAYIAKTCSPQYGSFVIEYPYCYLPPNFLETGITFALTLLSLGLTGFVAITDSRAALRGELYQTTSRPTCVGLGNVILSIAPWLSSISLTFFVQFGNINAFLTPGMLMFFLVSDAAAKVSVNECSRHLDACANSRRQRFSGVSSIKAFRLSILVLLSISVVRVAYFRPLFGQISSAALTSKVLAWSQLTLGVVLLCISALLSFAARPPCIGIEQGRVISP